jgi:hypothetical protein
MNSLVIGLFLKYFVKNDLLPNKRYLNLGYFLQLGWKEPSGFINFGPIKPIFSSFLISSNNFLKVSGNKIISGFEKTTIFPLAYFIPRLHPPP